MTLPSLVAPDVLTHLAYVKCFAEEADGTLSDPVWFQVKVVDWTDDDRPIVQFDNGQVVAVPRGTEYMLMN